MQQSRWERIESLFTAALDRAPAERAGFLDAACAGDSALRRELDDMLVADGPAPLRVEQKLPLNARAHEVQSLPPGTQVGAYRIESLIGEGGMGEVFRAERLEGGYEQTVALKVMRPGPRSAEMLRRFQLERQILARLVHPDIAAILDGGQLADGRPYLVLQYVNGVPITDYCEQNRLDINDRLRLFKRVADAVQFAHGRLIIHRDLKPSNIFVTPDGNPRLLDFGIAKMLDSDEADARTQSAWRMLTPEHAAPEQLLGEETSTATDVYALGLLLFQLLTGSRPFANAGKTPLEREQAITHEPAPMPSAVLRERAGARRLRGDLDHIVLMALRKEPTRRYVSAGQFAEDIDRHLAGLPVRAQPDTLAYRTRKFVARRRGLVASASIIGLMLAGFSVVTALQTRRVAQERDRAQQDRAAAESVIGLLTALFQRSNPTIVPGGDTIRIAALLEEGERRVDELAAQPALQARMWRVLGRMHAARSRFDRARVLLQRSYDMQRRVAGSSDSIAAATYHELARVVRDYEGPAAARAMFDTSVARLIRSLGPKHPDVALGIEDRASVEDDESRRRALFDSASAIRGQLPPPDSMALAGALNARGTQQWAAGHWLEAHASFDSSLRILDRLVSRDHANRLAVLTNIAATYGALAEWGAADSLQRVLLDAKRRTLGAESVEYATTLEGFALLQANQGRLGEAEAQLRGVLATLRHLVAADHVRIENTLRNLGGIVAGRGRIDEGLTILDSAIAMHRTRDGAGNPGMGYLLGQRAHLMLIAGREEQAYDDARAAERAMRQTVPKGDTRLADLEFWLGITDFAHGDSVNAAMHLGTAHEGYLKVYPAVHPLVAMAACSLGASLARLGRAAEAEPHLRESCSRHEHWGLASPVVVKWGREATAIVLKPQESRALTGSSSRGR